MTIPEQAVLEAERSVVGAILCAGCVSVDTGHRVFDVTIATGLHPAMFYAPSLGILYGQLETMRAAGTPLDPVSVGYELERNGAEPTVVGRLRQLTYETYIFSPAGRWAEIVVDSWRRRQAA